MNIRLTRKNIRPADMNMTGNPWWSEIQPKKAVRVFVVSYDAGTAWEKSFAAGSVPSDVTPEMTACTRDAMLISKPEWAFVSMWNNKGQEVRVPVSALEARPQTPKRVPGLACGLYRVRFENPGEGIDATVWKTIGPGSPPTVTIIRP